jgi:hypothetical protein
VVKTASKAFNRAHLQSVTIRTRINLLRAAATVLAFQHRNGKLPDQLVPDGQTGRAPMDLFAAKPLQYSREKRMIWSIGPDGTGPGGNAQKLSIALPAEPAPQAPVTPH